MKNKILGIALCTAGIFAVSSCGDYLETNSPSTVTASLATSSIDDIQISMLLFAIRSLAITYFTPWMLLVLISNAMVENSMLDV